MNEVKGFLTGVATSNGGGCLDDRDLMEVLTEAEVVHEGERNTHRWYYAYPCVVRVKGKLIRFQNMETTGDGCVWDCGLEHSLEDAVFVEERERTEVVKYYVEKEDG